MKSGIPCRLLLWAALMWWGHAHLAAADGRGPSYSPVQVFSNGVVVCPAGSFARGHAGAAAVLRLDFGLPPVPPRRRFQVEDLPILQTEWEHLGVRYTQRVLVTRLGEGPPDGLSEDAVLTIQIAGESLVPEYTNASASLRVQVGRDWWPLELRGGWIYSPERSQIDPLAFLDIPSVGIVKTNGLRLEFQGHMPPANSGAMTLYLPRQRLTSGPARERLMDMEFNEIFQRVRDFWRRPEAKQLRPPLTWGDAPGGRAGETHP
ncbi:MAG: hypothetical protein N3J91_10185 [Verrucomicrobiae bacterium]|nr:hypothetical protein [Verrucomicrobiae bacterium]